MAAARCLLSEEQFLCSICLDVFTHPVSTPCGHNFCRDCITGYWSRSARPSCPNCKRTYDLRPELQVNTFISELVAQFRQMAEESAGGGGGSGGGEQQVQLGEVPCDVCCGSKRKAVKSCLVCLTSYCHVHLEPHETRPALQRHDLIDAVMNLETRICAQHNKPLELFCKTEQTCVCMLCSVLEHKTHTLVPLQDAYEEQMTELKATKDELHQMVHERFSKGLEMDQLLKLSEEREEQERAVSVQIFMTLKDAVEVAQAEVLQTTQQRQRLMKTKVKGFIKELQQEAFELMTMISEREQLSRCSDQLHFLQSLSALEASPPTTDWTKVCVPPLSYEGTVVRAVAQLQETLGRHMKLLFEAELRRVRRHAVTVTLDPDLVHPRPSAAGHRADVCRCVLARWSTASTGRRYFEVQVTKWSNWTLGVTHQETITNKEVSLSPRGGFWTVWSKDGGACVAAAQPPVALSLSTPLRKVGVFVDHEQGVVSFYDADAASLVYSFTDCCFSRPLFPFFSPCSNKDGKLHTPDSSCVLQ